MPSILSKKSHAAYRGRISNVTLRNIEIVDGLFPYSIFYGYDGAHAVENIFIQNLRVHGKKITTMAGAKFYTEQTKNITIK